MTFEEASTVFKDPLGVTVPDDRFGKPRSWTIGQSEYGKMIVVAHIDDGTRIRIISARPANAT